MDDLPPCFAALGKKVKKNKQQEVSELNED